MEENSRAPQLAPLTVGSRKMLAYIKLAIITILFAYSASIYAGVVASVSRNPISEGESVELTISVDDSSDLNVDLSSLSDQFETLSQQTSRNISVVNGRQSSVSSLVIALMPKSSGSLRIPAFTVGSHQSAEIILIVKPAGDNAIVKNSGVIFSAQVDSKQVYVQAQLLLHLTLMSSQSITDGSIEQLVVEGATVRPLGEQHRYRKVVNGVSHDVIEINYAIFPQKSGRLIVPAITFNGAVSDGNRAGGFSLFFDGSRSKRVRQKTTEISVVVAPVPVEYPKNIPWLPLKQLTLSEDWSQIPTNFVVDKAVSRTFRIEAVGAIPAMLPSLPSDSSADFKIYADKKSPKETVKSDGFTTEITESQVVIPLRSGESSLKETKIVWFDTVNKKVMTSIVAAKKVQVEAAISVPVTPYESGQEMHRPVEQNDRQLNPVKDNWVWPIVALTLFIMLILVLAWAFFLRVQLAQQKSPGRPALSPVLHNDNKALKSLRREFADALTDKDLPRCARTLCELERIYRGLSYAPTLGEIADRLDDTGDRQIIRDLEAVLYSGREKNVDISVLSTLIDRLRPGKAAGASLEKNELPHMYL